MRNKSELKHKLDEYTNPGAMNQTEPKWYSNVTKYYIEFWRGGTIQTTHIHNLLKQSQDQPDFVNYLIKFKTFIESNPTILPCVKKYYFFDTVQLITTREEFKQLDAVVGNLIQINSPPISVSSILNTVTSVLSLVVEYVNENPVQSMILLLSAAAAVTTASFQEATPRRKDTCDNEDCITFTESLSRSEVPFTACAPFETNLSPALEIQRISTQIDYLVIEANNRDKQNIKEALTKVCNLKVAHLLVENDVRVAVVSEQEMQKLVGIEDYSACFATYPKNKIYLNKHSINNENQLDFILANVVSHASIHNNRELKLKVDKSSRFKPLLPWKNQEEQKEKMFYDAYKTYTKRVQEYETLHKRKLSKEPITWQQKESLNDFYKALETYLIPQYGAHQLNSLQVVLKKEGDQVIEDRTGLFHKKKSEHYARNPLKHREYLANIYFQELRNKEIQEEVFYQNNIGIYQSQHAKEHLFADQLSDFESLSPDMRQLLGPELCDLLSDFLESEDHCSRVNWPKT